MADTKLELLQGIRLKPATKHAIRLLATAEGTSLRALCAKILTEYAERNV